MIIYSRCTTPEELNGIIYLQKANLPSALDQAEIASQGFVTVVHQYKDIENLNNLEQHIIGKDGEKVIAYLLAMTVASRSTLPVLVPMFDAFEKMDYKGKKISGYHYIVVGQVCVDKAYRGKGILDECYAYYKDQLSPSYDFAITEIDASNPRSLNAHRRIGFKEIGRYIAPNKVEWVVVLWQW